jgi:hypothetical protein
VTFADGPRRRHRARTLSAAEEAVVLVLATFRRPVTRAEILRHGADITEEWVSGEDLGAAADDLVFRGSVIETDGGLVATTGPAASRPPRRRVVGTLAPAEEWRTVARPGGRFEVSDQGRLRTRDPGSERSRRVAVTYPDGVPTVGLPGSGKLVAVARLVLEAFAGPPPVTPGRIAYRDGDEGNVKRENLAWA